MTLFTMRRPALSRVRGAVGRPSPLAWPTARSTALDRPAKVPGHARCSGSGRFSPGPPLRCRRAAADDAVATRNETGRAAGRVAVAPGAVVRRASHRPPGRPATSSPPLAPSPRDRASSRRLRRGRRWLAGKSSASGSHRRAGPPRDGRPSALEHLVACQPPITISLFLRGEHGGEELSPLPIQAAQQVNAGDHELVAIAEAAGGHSLGCELLELRGEGRAVHG